MGCVQRNGVFIPHNVDFSFYKLIKIRKVKSCQICRKRLEEGSYCLGGWGWCSCVCLDCADEVLKNGVESVEFFCEQIKEFQKDFQEKVEELKYKNMVNYL